MKYILLLLVAAALAAMLVMKPAAPASTLRRPALPVTVPSATEISTPAATPSGPTQQPAAMLAEDFEQTAVGAVPVSLRATSGKWAVQTIDGKKVLQGQPAADNGDGIRGMLAFGANDWKDFAVAFRFRYAEKPEALVLRVRCAGNSDYYNLHLDQEKGLLAAFVRNAWHMVKYEHTLPAANEWHRYHAVCRDRSVEVTIDGTKIIDAPVDLPVQGQCELFIVKGTLLIDDLRVTPLDAPPRAKSEGGDF